MAKKSLPTSGIGGYKPSKADIERERRFRAQDALSTLQRAAEIKKDKDLLKDVKIYVKEQSKIANKI